MALRCLTLRERNLHRQQNKLTAIKSTEKKMILIEPNSEVVIIWTRNYYTLNINRVLCGHRKSDQLL